MTQNKSTKEEWGSRLGFIFAALGMAVGTGNIWRFPRVAGTNHGGAFLIAYIICNLIWVVPLFMTEMAIGRATKMGPIGAMRDFYGKNKTWMGGFVVWICAAITFYYSVIFGYAIRYFVYALTGTMKPGFDSEALWNTFRSNPFEMSLFHLIAVILTVFVIYRGVQGGLEKLGKIAIPALFVSMILAAVWALTKPGAIEGLRFLFVPDFKYLANSKVWLNALTQAAWSSGAGWGMMLTYANYLKKKDDIAASSLMISFGDMCGALTAAIAVLPAVFALSATSGEDLAALGSGNYGLTFIYLSKLFYTMPGGSIIAIFFFLALSLAAYTSIVPQTEAVVRSFINWGWDRKKATIFVGAIIFIAGLPSAIWPAFNANQDWVWGIGLLICGVFFAMAVYKFGVDRFRTELVNYGAAVYVGKWYNYAIMAFPVLLTIVVGWWLIQSMSWYPDNWWNPFLAESTGTVILQNVLAMVILWAFNNKMAENIKQPSLMSEGKFLE